MALQTKTISANGARGRQKFTLTVNEESTSVAANTSAVSWALVISPVRTGWDWESTAGKVKYAVAINGKTYSGIIERYDGSSTVTIKSGTETCAHAADGSGSVSYSFTITDSDAWEWGPGNASASGSMALTTIPRQANITAAPNFNDEQNPTITYSNPAGSAVDSLELCITLDGTTQNALAYKPVSETGTSFTYTLSEADRNFLRNATPDSNALEVGFYLRTVIGGVEYFSKVWRTLTIVNAAPEFDPVIQDINADTAALTGGEALIRYFSRIYFETGAAAQKGARLVSQSVTCGGITVEAAAGYIEAVPSGDFVFAATDSRGNTATLTVPVPFVEYVAPTCSIGNSKPDTDGDFTLTASGACYVGNIASAGSNDLYVLYRVKTGSGDFSDWYDMAVTKGENSYTASVNFTGLDYRTTYTFQCKVGDLVTTATTDEVAIKAMPVFDWSGEDFNFNVPVSAPSLALDGVQLDYIVEQGTSGIWTYRKWNSGIAECWGRKSVSTTITTAWGSLFSSGALAGSNVELPFTFKDVPCITVALTNNGAGVFLMAAGSWAPPSTTTTGAFELVRGTSSSTSNSYGFNYQVKGRWK